MNRGTIQHQIDLVVDASRQQWLLRLVAVAAVAGAIVASAAADRHWSSTAVVIMAAIAALSSLHPDSNGSLITIGIVIARLLVTVDALDTPWLPVAAVCLLIHHTAIAIAATLPIGGSLPPTVLIHWSRRAATIAVATVALWFVVVALDRRDLPGSTALTALAFATTAVAALAVRIHTLDESS